MHLTRLNLDSCVKDQLWFENWGFESGKQNFTAKSKTSFRAADLLPVFINKSMFAEYQFSP